MRHRASFNGALSAGASGALVACGVVRRRCRQKSVRTLTRVWGVTLHGPGDDDIQAALAQALDKARRDAHREATNNSPDNRDYSDDDDDVVPGPES